MPTDMQMSRASQVGSYKEYPNLVVNDSAAKATTGLAQAGPIGL